MMCLVGMRGAARYLPGNLRRMTMVVVSDHPFVALEKSYRIIDRQLDGIGDDLQLSSLDEPISDSRF